MSSNDMAIPASEESAADWVPARGRARQPALASAVLSGIEEADVRWCLLRGGLDALARADDVDILVAAADLDRAARVIEEHGFIRLAAYGRGTHVFFLGLDLVTSSWVELDVVTEIAYGRNFELRTGAESACLARRQRRHGVWMLAPEDEFWALLLHCLFDKRMFAVHHVGRLKQLVAMASLESPLVRAMPPSTAYATLLESARVGAWPALLARRRALLSAWRSTHPAAVARRSIASAALRLVERPLQTWGRRGISVALLGPDGAGKSTLAEGIESVFYFPVRRVYMGLWPSDAQPLGLVAQVRRVLLRPFVVWRRYLAALRHQALGRLVVFDRYVYDALLPPRGSLRWLKRPYLRLLSRLCPAPDMVLLLDAPGSAMYARSGEYDPEHLEAERAVYRRLDKRIPHLQRVDAQRPAQAVLADALARIWRQYMARAR